MEVLHYVTESGKDVVGEWLAVLNDKRAAAKIVMRLDRLSEGNFGNRKALRDGVWELRIDGGPGYRIYYAMADKACVLLLCGGDKRKQSADVKRAVRYWKDYRERTKNP